MQGGKALDNITEHPTWEIKDSSKINDYILCPRYYFYHYILGWKLDQEEHDLVFGDCYHKAREYQRLYGYDDVAGAYDRFITSYREHFDPSSDEYYLPKTPTAVLNALQKFALEYQSDLIDNEVVEIDGIKMTEISGTVPVDEKRVLHYRMDSIMRRIEDGKIFSWDDKTTSGKWIHDLRWDNELYLGIQNGTYTHCLYCMFPIELVLGVEFVKIGFEYLRKGSANRPAGYHATIRKIPAFKTPDQMNVWLWTVNSYLDEIERDMDRLYHSSENDSVLMAFKMNPHSCTSYRGCMYHDYCMAWSNPLQQCYEPPLGFIQKFWNPMEKEFSVQKDLKWRG